MGSLRVDTSRVSGTALGLEHTRLQELLQRFPELVELMERQRVYILEASWPFGMKWNHHSRTRPDLDSVQRRLEETLIGSAQPSGPPGATTYLLGELRINFARALGGGVQRLAGFPVLGWCGYYEGGVDFVAADGTVVKSGHWHSARNYLVRWCSGESQRHRARQFLVGGSRVSEVHNSDPELRPGADITLKVATDQQMSRFAAFLEADRIRFSRACGNTMTIRFASREALTDYLVRFRNLAASCGGEMESGLGILEDLAPQPIPP
jgi:hypothetical protein